MSKWIVKGLRTGIKTTRYPAELDNAPGVSPGFPVRGDYAQARAQHLADRCPTSALRPLDGYIEVDYRRCVHCYRCVRETEVPMRWRDGYEWAVSARAGSGPILGRQLQHSIHVLVVDAGDCGACLNEVRQLDNPYYNFHRLGFFITPTPRQADVLLVVGPVTDHMRIPLQKAYQAMPAPKCVVAVGACALSGGVFGPSFAVGTGVSGVIPVDVEVAGHPPPPLAIVHGLLVAAGRAAPATMWQAAGRQGAGEPQK